MDIIKTFQSNGFTKDITIIGTHENPLFRALDIGEVLDFKCIRATMVDFDASEKVVSKSNSQGGEQMTSFLTEKGLYKLLFRSRKPIAIQFQDWVCTVIKEIRLNGQYVLQKELEEKNKQIEQMVTEKKMLEDKTNNLEDELERLSNSTMNPIIYIYSTDTRAEKPLLKIGSTLKFAERAKPYKQTHPHGKMIFYKEIPADVNLKLVEHYIQLLLRQHKVKGEVFDMSIEEAKLWIMSIMYDLNLTDNQDEDERIKRLTKVVELKMKDMYGDQHPTIAICEIACQTEVIKDDNDIIENIDNSDKFAEFVFTCCDLDDTYEVSSVDIIGAYRLWSRSVSKDIYHKLLDYFQTEFRPIRLSEQNKTEVVNGFRGLRLKPKEIKMSNAPSDAEVFIHTMCVFSPSGKCLQSKIITEFTEWKKRVNKALEPTDAKNVKKYLKDCQHVLSSNIWTHHGNGQGYYGITLKTELNYHRKSSSTGKRVEKRSKEDVIIDTWTTIAKAAEAEGIPAARMSRCIKDKTLFEGDYYYVAKND